MPSVAYYRNSASAEMQPARVYVFRDDLGLREVAPLGVTRRRARPREQATREADQSWTTVIVPAHLPVHSDSDQMMHPILDSPLLALAMRGTPAADASTA